VPDSNQRSLAGEYYVAYLLNLAGFDTALTIGSAKSYDLFASGPGHSRTAIQVKTNLGHYDWLVRDAFPDRPGDFVVFVRLSTRQNTLPEVYSLKASQANLLIDRRYSNHSPRIPRAAIRAQTIDHDLSAIFTYLNRECA
jgi:hypothetical protein